MSGARFPYIATIAAGRYRIYYVDRKGCQTYTMNRASCAIAYKEGRS